MDLTIYGFGNLIEGFQKEPNLPQSTKLVRLDSEVHAKAERLSKELGFTTVDELIKDVVSSWVSFIS